MSFNGAVSPNATFSFHITSSAEGTRLDTYLSKEFSAYSRNFFQDLIKREFVTINSRTVTKVSTPLKASDVLVIQFPPPRTIQPKPLENIQVEIIYQHKHFIIINKPAGLLVHPTSNASTAITLVDWLLTYFPETKSVGYADRPGIVHRLDKDTSGLMIIPRTNYAHHTFSMLFKNRMLFKTYQAVVHGHTDPSGTIESPIARNKTHRNKMITVAPSITEDMVAGKIRPARTYYYAKAYLDHEYTHINAQPVTGRTHQVRVHLASIGHALVGDPVYGKKSAYIQRQALHAYSLTFDFEGEHFSFVKEMPDDMITLIQKLDKK